MIFSTVRAPHDPAFTDGSLATTSAGRPSTRPRPVTTPSAGSPAARALANWPSSTNEPGSNNSPIRSRTNSLCARASLAAAASDGARVASRAVRIRSLMASFCLSLDREPEATGEDQPLDLRGALTDLQDLRVAIEPRDRVLLHEAVAAEHLSADPGRSHRGLGGIQLC